MIHDLANLEPLLRQYDPEKVLVGPLLNLWTNSSFRVFNIAGNGGKIHQTIGLGFVKVETDAQRRRADIVAVLHSRFGEVQIFDSQLEMARVAHTLWANDETSRFLATATAESKLQMTRKVDQDQSLNDTSKSSVPPSDRDKEFLDEAARGSVALDAASAHAPLSARDQTQPTPACDPTQTHEPLNLSEVYASFPLDGDSLTFAVVGLKSSTEGVATTETPAETDANTETAAESGANTETTAGTDANTDTIAETNSETAAATDANTFDARSAKPKRRSRRRRRGSPAGADAAPAAAVVNTETIPVEQQWQNQVSSGASAFGEDHALRQRSQGRDLVLLPTPTAADLKWPIVERIIALCIMILGVASVIVLLIYYEQSIGDNVPTPSASLYSGSASASVEFTGAAPVNDRSAGGTEPAAPPPSNPAALFDDDKIARLIRRGKDFLKDGDFPNARLLFKRAADAGSAEAARALGSTYDPAMIKQFGGVSVSPDIDSALKWYAIAADRGSAEAADQYANLLQPPQTTGTVAAVVTKEPTSKPAKAARAQDRAPPAWAPPTPPSQMSSTQAPAGPDDLTSQSPKMPHDQADATSDSGPQARPSQVPGAQVATVPVPAASQVARAHLSTAPTSEPKLPPSSAESTQILAGRDRQRLKSEVASPPAVEASASGGSQRPPLQERSTTRQLKPDEITALISRGNDFLKTGDFSAARTLLKRGAESGSADAALMLGKTFDPLFLHRIGAIGIKPDVAQCRQWYQKAVELGSEAAAQQLANLTQTGQ
jgi:TPR repeat protein